MDHLRIGIKIFLAFLILSAASLVGGYFFAGWQGGYTVEQYQGLISPNGLHYAYYGQREFYEAAYSAARGFGGPNGGAEAVITNHHLVGARLIAQAIGVLATDTPVTVVVVSPNHYSMGKSDVIMSAAAWQTPYGELEPDLAAINALQEGRLASVEEEPFDQEQGVSGIVAFIKRSLPNARVVPLIIKDHVTVEEARDLASKIGTAIPQDAKFVGSFDFSHYLTLPAADFHDVASLGAIETFDFTGIDRLDMDSHPGLALLLQILKDRGYGKFNLLERNNSARLAARDDILETTGYVTGYFTKGDPSPNRTVTALGYGDFSAEPAVSLSLDRHEKTFGFKFLERLFFGQDLTMGALAGADPRIKGALERYGYNGLDEGQDFCEARDISGNKVGVCLFSATIGDIGMAQVKEMKGQTGFVIVMLSDAALPQSQKELFGRGLANAGADAVLFSGSSQIGPLEIYRGKLIVYGQGDRISKEVLEKGHTGIAVGLVHKEGRLEADLFPVRFDGGQGKLLLKANSDIVLAELAGISAVSQEIKSQIKQGQVIIE